MQPLKTMELPHPIQNDNDTKQQLSNIAEQIKNIPAWCMCSEEEAEERRRLSEVSIFERRSTFMYHDCDDRNKNSSSNYISTVSNNNNSRNRSDGKQVCSTMGRNGKSSLQRRLEAASEQQKGYENCSVGDCLDCD